MASIVLRNSQKALILEHCILGDDVESQMRSSSRTHFRISKSDLEDTMGWLSGAANHAKDTEEQDAINDLCDELEASLG
jgi:hypothetical protein